MAHTALWARLSKIGLSGLSIVFALAILHFAQGGYFGFPVCAVGIVLWLIAAVLCALHRDKQTAFPIVPSLLLALAALYLLATFATTPTATALLETATWFSVAAIGFLAWRQTPQQRKVTLDVLAWLGVPTAVFGFTVYSGIVSLAGGVFEGRLQSAFQYANAAAAWYGAVAFLCAFSSSRWLRCLAPIPLSAMLLCMSGGATVALALAFAVAVAAAHRERRAATLVYLAGAASIAAAVFALVKLAPSPLDLLVLAVAATGCVLLEKLIGCSTMVDGAPRKVLIGVCAALLCLLAVLALTHADRIAQAMGTFSIRLVYNLDALGALVSSGLFGLGPDMWRFEYPHFQSAQYSTAIVHCSYLQIAVDAGGVALVVLVAAIALGLRALWPHRNEHVGEIACIALLCAHSLLDFDLQFAALAGLLAVLLCQPSSRAAEASESLGPKSKSQSVTSLPSIVGGVLLSLACAVICFWGLAERSSVQLLGQAALDGDYREAARLYAADPLVMEDPLAQEYFLRASLAWGRYDEVEGFCAYEGVSTSTHALLAFEGLSRAGLKEAAAEILLSELEMEPYNIRFYREAKRSIKRYELPKSYMERFEGAVEKANYAALHQNSLWPKKPKLIR